MTPRRRASLVLLFALYLGLLVWTVLWKLDIPWVGGTRIVKVVPFVATRAAGPSAPAEVAVNLLLFVPFGVYLGLLAPRRPWWAGATAVAAVSLTLETTQYALAVGRSDTTDVIVNTAGGVVGLGLVMLAGLALGPRTTAVVTRLCAVVTALVLAGGGLYAATYGPVVHGRDVGPLTRAVTPAGQGWGAAAPSSGDEPHGAARNALAS